MKSVTGRKFEVESRYLVATVKGTEFRIVLGEQGDLLRVLEGVVKATPRGGGESLDVAAGQWVLANASGLLLLVPPGGEPAGSAPSPVPPEPAPPSPEASPTSEDATGDVHGVNGEEQHNHSGTKGGDVRDTHGESKSDNGSLKELEVWPLPRTAHAEALDNIVEAKPRVIAYNVDFSSASLPAADLRFQDSLARAGGKRSFQHFYRWKDTEAAAAAWLIQAPVRRSRSMPEQHPSTCSPPRMDMSANF